MSDTPREKTEQPDIASRIIEGAKEALAIAKGSQPAAAIWHNGHCYVPASRKFYWLVTFEDGRVKECVANPGLGPSGDGLIVSVERKDAWTEVWAEVERLREALEEAAAELDDHGAPFAASLARAVLNGGEHG